MTDRYFALTVVLDREIREDDAEPIINAIKIIRGVLSVEPHIADVETYANRQRIHTELEKKLWAVLHDDRVRGA